VIALDRQKLAVKAVTWIFRRWRPWRWNPADRTPGWRWPLAEHVGNVAAGGSWLKRPRKAGPAHMLSVPAHAEARRPRARSCSCGCCWRPGPRSQELRSGRAGVLLQLTFDARGARIRSIGPRGSGPCPTNPRGEKAPNRERPWRGASSSGARPHAWRLL